MLDTSHLDSLRSRLSNERARYARDPSPIRAVWVEACEREIAHELAFLGITDEAHAFTSRDEELLRQLGIE